MPMGRVGYLGACLLLSAPCAVGGCASRNLLESRRIDPGVSDPVAGTSYYLPKKLLRVEVWQFGVKQPKRDDSGKEVVDPDTKQVVEEDVLRHFAIHDATGRDEVVVPDIRHHYVIVPRWDSASDDTVAVSLTSKGLLTKVSGTSVDQTAGIVRGIVDIARLVAGVPPGPSSATRGLGKGADAAPRQIAQYEFDPVDPADRARVQAALAKYSITLAIDRQPDCPVATSGTGCCPPGSGCQPGIYYRLPIPYRMRLAPAGVFRPAGSYGSTTGEWEYVEGGTERTVLLPNEAVCMYAPVTRAQFVTSRTELVFEEGMLTSVSTEKPSELLGFVKIPLDAASAILAIPADLLTVRIKEIGDQASIDERRAAAEKARLEQQIQLLDAMRRLRTEEANVPKGPSGG